jgi:hypothetical protein
MKSKVFEIGFGHTGSRSLAVAMRTLGFTVSHGVEPEFLSDFTEKVLRGRVDFAATRTFDYIGNAMAAFYEDLADKFPDARFILPIRDSREWAAGYARVYRAGTLEAALKGALNERVILRLLTWGCVAFNKTKAVRRFDRHNEAVQRFFAGTDRLLVIRVCEGEGWDKLCPFVGADIPAVDFPHIESGKAQRLTRHLLQHGLETP